VGSCRLIDVKQSLCSYKDYCIGRQADRQARRFGRESAGLQVGLGR
jgi:hypothetical protein